MKGTRGRAAAILCVVAIFLLQVSVAGAQSGLKRQVLSTFIYTRYGDSTPFVLPSPPTLTPLGAQQLYEAGDGIRRRYVSPSDDDDEAAEVTTIPGLSLYQIDNGHLTVMATDDEYVSASALAFLQGLYPPLQTGSNYTYIAGQSTLQNGTNVVAPLNGYQYPNVRTLSANDVNSIYVSGMESCPMYMESSNDYYRSPAFLTVQNTTADFYARLQPDLLSGVFANASVGYFDAYYIYDYLNYGMIHNTSIADTLAHVDLTKARILAADLAFALNADVDVSGSTPGDHIRAIAGRTLATRILQSFYTTINTNGTTNKMTLLFGGPEPMIALAALAGLVSPQNAAFYNLPAPGSSFIFELFSMQAEGVDAYPSTDDLFIRFFYQNGTGPDASLVAYPLFGLSPSQTLISFADFTSGLSEFMVATVEDWCTTCSSFSIFCPAFVNDSVTNLNPAAKSSAKHTGLAPAIAGVIGAAVALALAALLVGVVMVFGGVRIHRAHVKRRSELGGFKGAEKLASDQDLTVPKGGAGAVVVTSPDGGPPNRGHERVGSWELSDQRTGRPTTGADADGTAPGRSARLDDDCEDEMAIGPYTAPVDPRQHV